MEPLLAVPVVEHDVEAARHRHDELLEAAVGVAAALGPAGHVVEVVHALDVEGDVPGTLDLLYIDGAHRVGPARDDIVKWGAKVSPGGTLLIHDAYSSVGVTLALLTTLIPGGRFRYLGRDGSLARYRREDLRGRDRVANSIGQLLELGWFARNVLVKVLLVARLGRVARLLGHDGETWPY